MDGTAISYSSRYAMKTRSIRDPRLPVKRRGHRYGRLWQDTALQLFRVWLSFFTTRAQR
jgi:hypothetical protein